MIFISSINDDFATYQLYPLLFRSTDDVDVEDINISAEKGTAADAAGFVVRPNTTHEAKCQSNFVHSNNFSMRKQLFTWIEAEPGETRRRIYIVPHVSVNMQTSEQKLLNLAGPMWKNRERTAGEDVDGEDGDEKEEV